MLIGTHPVLLRTSRVDEQQTAQAILAEFKHRYQSASFARMV